MLFIKKFAVCKTDNVFVWISKYRTRNMYSTLAAQHAAEGRPQAGLVRVLGGHWAGIGSKAQQATQLIPRALCRL